MRKYFAEKAKGAIKQSDTLFLIYTWEYPVSNIYSYVGPSECTYPISSFLVLFSIEYQLMYKVIHANAQWFLLIVSSLWFH